MPLAAALVQEMVWSGTLVPVVPPLFINPNGVSPQTMLLSLVAQEIDIGRKANRLFAQNRFNQSAMLIGPFSVTTEACYAAFRRLQQQAFLSSAPQQGPRRDPYYLLKTLQIQAAEAVTALDALIQSMTPAAQFTLAYQVLKTRSALVTLAIRSAGQEE
jgi:hypothetical protein